MKAITLCVLLLPGVAAYGGIAHAYDWAHACTACQSLAGDCWSNVKSIPVRRSSSKAKRALGQRCHALQRRCNHTCSTPCPPYLVYKDGVCCATAGSLCWDPATSEIGRNRSAQPLTARRN